MRRPAGLPSIARPTRRSDRRQVPSPPSLPAWAKVSLPAPSRTVSTALHCCSRSAGTCHQGGACPGDSGAASRLLEDAAVCCRSDGAWQRHAPRVSLPPRLVGESCSPEHYDARQQRSCTAQHPHGPAPTRLTSGATRCMDHGSIRAGPLSTPQQLTLPQRVRRSSRQPRSTRLLLLLLT